MKIFFLLAFAFSAFADSFVVGEGARYGINFSGDQSVVDLSIYIADKKNKDVSVEYHFATTNSLIPIEMYQQFTFDTDIKKNGYVIPRDGYVLTDLGKSPEILTSEYSKVQKGVQVGDFLFSDKSELDKFKIGVETLEFGGGTLQATHYRKQRDGQVVDFWISESAKPIGLVKLTSKGKTAAQNYELNIKSLLRNVKPAIDKSKAVPLTDATKKLLPKPI